MARYTNLFTAAATDSVSALKVRLTDTLKSCDLNLIYEASDYLVAKEKPGQVAYAKLTTIEILINPPSAGSQETQVNLVVKNEELPLNSNNHCQRVFQVVNQAIYSNSCWQAA